MIVGKTIKEMHMIQRANVDYRSLGALNCSMIKLFDKDPVKFFEQFKLGRKKENKSTVSLILGDLVDFYLLDCKGNETEFDSRYDEKFALYSGSKGNGQVYVLAETLFNITQDSTNENGEVTTSFSTRFKEALQKIQALGKYSGKKEEKVLEDFNENGLEYFEYLMENTGKTVIDLSLLDKAKKIGDLIKDDEFTRGIFSESEDVEYFPKFPIQFIYPGTSIECKAEVDILKIDHCNKVIQIMDLKTTYDNENFEYSYIRNGYYLQAAFYHKAVTEWATSEGMREYEIVPMQFIVGDTSGNNRRPIIYKTNHSDVNKSCYGFTLRGVAYKGLDQLIKEIQWAESKDMWNCSKEVYDNKGIMKLRIKYE